MSTETPTFPAGIQVVNQLYAAFVREDPAAIMALLNDDLDWRESENFMLSDRNPYRTPAAVADGVFRRLATDVQGYEALPSEIFDAGSVVIALGRSKGTIVATGKTFDAQYAHVWRVTKGKITGFQQIIDTLEVWRAQRDE
ncbi:ketosteroid isomerase [Novosphingobium barchaimii LL02]|uniref:Ketosteroid isomerase n=1 Tax=Novosphingobium barchaimii LL02 TaxID=1114963 RepID=A0A0J7XR90_9SPHN|nr:nuclear transport factor 2 family protein [Novosphingobium barchaimii]KMS53558.1 ketosteroid isomerase [Novosphingobium barchaimii LL02]